MNKSQEEALNKALALLGEHFEAFMVIPAFADPSGVQRTTLRTNMTYAQLIGTMDIHKALVIADIVNE